MVNTLAPETEADPALLTVSFLVAFGSAVGPGPHARADGAMHPARLNAVGVGDTSKARKGTSWARTHEVMVHADNEWAERRIISGLSTGEGLIRAAADSGHDKRIMVVEPEFSRVLIAAGRESNTLSPVLRLGWDSGNLSVVTKEAVRADGAHVSVLGHMTIDEARAYITPLQASNGFANRFLFTCATRGDLLPNGGNLDEQLVVDLGRKVGDSLDRARTLGLLRRTSAADELWRKLYADMAGDTPGGLLGGLVARAEAQVLRLSLVYALTDASSRVDLKHLEAAWAMWRYCRQSAEFIFGDQVPGGRDGAKVWSIIREAGPGGIARNALSQTLSGKLVGAPLDRVLGQLEGHGWIQLIIVPTRGRPKTVIAPLR